MDDKRHVWMIEYYYSQIGEWIPVEFFGTRSSARELQKDAYDGRHKTRIVKYIREVSNGK